MNINTNTGTAYPKRLFTRILTRHEAPIISAARTISDNLPTPPASSPQTTIVEPAAIDNIDVQEEPIEPTGTPVEPTPTPTLTEEEVSETVESESPEPQRDTAGTSVDELPITAAQKRMLKANDIETIESLEALIDSGYDLVDLKEIGAKSAVAIKEGLSKWLLEQKKM